MSGTCRGEGCPALSDHLNVRLVAPSPLLLSPGPSHPKVSCQTSVDPGRPPLPGVGLGRGRPGGQ